MNDFLKSPIILNEGRFARFEAIAWWDQSILNRARVLVIGAGALGNEVIKNLALLGIGNIVVVDMDHVELSNLTRSVLFRESDHGQPKAECAARAAKAIYPDINIRPIIGNILADVGLGYFRWSDIVVGALDNREARVYVNSACAQVGRPWIDGGIEVLNGIVRIFAPPKFACYECTMSKVDWNILNQRRSCSLLARRAMNEGGTPTTPTTASVIGAIQAQEVVKLLHGMSGLVGSGFIFEGRTHNSYSVNYLIKPDCDWHDPPPPIEAIPTLNSDTPLQTIWKLASQRLGGLDAIDFGRELVDKVECQACGWTRTLLKPVDHISEDQIHCGDCSSECLPIFFHTVGAESHLLGLSSRQIGLPSWDIVWGRREDQYLGIEITGDSPFNKNIYETG